MKGIQAVLLEFTAREESFSLTLNGGRKVWMEVLDDEDSITKSHLRDILEDLIGRTAVYTIDPDDFVVGITADPPDIVPGIERRPPPVKRCRLGEKPLSGNAAVALVAEDSSGGFRFVVCPDYDQWLEDNDREPLGVF